MSEDSVAGELIGFISLIGLIVTLAVVCFPNAGWPLWFVAICTVAFWLFLIIVILCIVAIIIVIIVAWVWMRS